MPAEKPPPVPSVDQVRHFWDSTPLFSGESNYAQATPEWFAEHTRVVIDDCFAGQFDNRTLPPPENRKRVLDLGCGPGFWTIELLQRCQVEVMTSADLTQQANDITRKRLALFRLKADVRIENAEDLTFSDNSFDHVNCQGVIHHTPNTEACVSEISRVLRPGGTACISVYYRNILLRNWRQIGFVGEGLARLGGGLIGRGREGIYRERDPKELVRLYDGAENPIGKAYDRREFWLLLAPYFEIEKIYYHFFPARSLPFRIPRAVHQILDAGIPFMIYANVRKLYSAF
jgi:SAM-dependent methyltransferase